MITNGIKPTRLWHLTGKKHFTYWLNDRITAVKNSTFSQRDKKDLIKLVGWVLALASGVAYSYGVFSPPKDLTTVIRPPGTCDKKSKKSCPKTKQPVPCPPEYKPPRSKPCPEDKR